MKVAQKYYYRYVGTSAETKPQTEAEPGHEFYETDTGRTYIYDGSAWVLKQDLVQVSGSVATDIADILEAITLGAGGATCITVAAVADTYTLDLNLAWNFAITTADAVAKTVVFSNQPSNVNSVYTITLIMTYTNAAAMTWPAAVTWKDSITPLFTAGKTYILTFTTVDNGTTYLGASVGEW